MFHHLVCSICKYIQSFLGIFFVSESPPPLALRERMGPYQRSVHLYGESLFIATHYTREIRRLIHRAKYSSDHSAMRVLEDVFLTGWSTIFQELRLSPSIPIVIISPRSHFLIRWYRRGDFVGELSESLSRHLRGSGYLVSQVRVSHRLRWTHQAGSSRSERSNKGNRFFLAKRDLRSIVNDGVFIYLDDVISTGSTLREIQSLIHTYAPHHHRRHLFYILSSSHH